MEYYGEGWGMEDHFFCQVFVSSFFHLCALSVLVQQHRHWCSDMVGLGPLYHLC